MKNDLLLSIQVCVIVALLACLFHWSLKVYRSPKDYRKKRMFEIQNRLREIHNNLVDEETDVFSRQKLFNEQMDLIDERRALLDGRLTLGECEDA